MREEFDAGITRRRHTCDCGFQWLSGNDGSHNCSEHYRKKIKMLERKFQEIALAFPLLGEVDPKFNAEWVLGEERKRLHGLINE